MALSSTVTLKQLRYFARIVELGSISRASHDLHVAQTAVGLQVRALEDSLGSSLLLRHPKGVEPTELGRFVYEQSRQVLGAVDLLCEEVQKRLERKPRSTWLGLAPNIMAVIGTQALLNQQEKLPNVQLHLSEATRSSLIEAVLAGDLNWAIAHEVADVEGLSSVPVLRQSLALITRPGEGPPGGEVRLCDAIKRELVLDSGRRVVSGVLSAASQLLGVTPNVRFQVDSTPAIKQIIRTEGLSGLLTRSMVREELRRGEFEAHTIIDPPLEITASFVYAPGRPPSELDRPTLEFIDALLDEHVSSHPEGEVRMGRVVAVLAEGSEIATVGMSAPRKVTSR